MVDKFCTQFFGVFIFEAIFSYTLACLTLYIGFPESRMLGDKYEMMSGMPIILGRVRWWWAAPNLSALKTDHNLECSRDI